MYLRLVALLSIYYYTMMMCCNESHVWGHCSVQHTCFLCWVKSGEWFLQCYTYSSGMLHRVFRDKDSVSHLCYTDPPWKLPMPRASCTPKRSLLAWSLLHIWPKLFWSATLISWCKPWAGYIVIRILIVLTHDSPLVNLMLESVCARFQTAVRTATADETHRAQGHSFTLRQ